MFVWNPEALRTIPVLREVPLPQWDSKGSLPTYSVQYWHLPTGNTYYKVSLAPGGDSSLFFINVTGITNQLKSVTYENTISNYRNRILKFQMLFPVSFEKAKQNKISSLKWLRKAD